MKLCLLSSSIALIGLAQPATAEVTHKSLSNAEAIVFDAVCTPVSEGEGYLKVDLQAEKIADSFFVRGTFYSRSEASTDRDSRLIPIAECRALQAELKQGAGKKILLSGQVSERTYEVDEEVWGTCREHPRAGGERYPCRRGTRKVTKRAREVLLDLGGISIVNNN